MKTTVFITGGGTGGHVYPALAIADALEKKYPGKIDFHFLGTKRGMEVKVVPEHGIQLHLLKIGRFAGVSKFEKIMTLLFMPLAFAQALWLILRYRPKAIIGVGGYASFPAVIVGSLMARNTYIWEPNARPGMANVWLSKFAKHALVVFESTKKKLSSRNYEIVGYPVRGEIAQRSGENAVRKEGPLKILIFGGSQGARPINKIVKEAILKSKDWLEGVEIVHQVGKWDYSEFSTFYETLNLRNVECHEFLFDMEERYLWADMVVCRAGMGTIAELAAMGQACWLIPLPGGGLDQQENATELANKGAAIMTMQPQFTAEEFIEKIESIKQDRDILVRLSENISDFHTPKGAEKIAEFIWNTK